MTDEIDSSTAQMGEYWNDILADWESSAYQGGQTGRLVERVGSRFRGHIRDRAQSAFALIKDQVPGSTIIEIGCGSGEFCLALAELQPSQVIGLDVSQEAIELASAHAEQLGLLPERVRFVQALVGEDFPHPPAIDLVVGLGITEYVHLQDLKSFLNSVEPTYFLLSFDEKRLNLQKVVHKAYRLIKQLPYYYRFSQLEMRQTMTEMGFIDVRTFRDGANAFVTNIPSAKTATDVI